MNFNTEFLNKTANKTARPAGRGYIGVIWHETASNGDGEPRDTLRYNLAPSVGSSYDVLVARSGEAFKYLDWHNWTSWDSGVASGQISGMRYSDWALNSVTLGVELDGRNDGVQKATAEQLDSAARLALLLRDTEAIPLETGHHLTHASVALPRGRKTDPRAYTIAQLLKRAGELDTKDSPMAEANFPLLWGKAAPYRSTFGIPSRWRLEYLRGNDLGAAVTDEVPLGDGWSVQRFTYGVIVYGDGQTDVVRKS